MLLVLLLLLLPAQVTEPSYAVCPDPNVNNVTCVDCPPWPEFTGVPWCERTGQGVFTGYTTLTFLRVENRGGRIRDNDRRRELLQVDPSTILRDRLSNGNQWLISQHSFSGADVLV